MTSWWLMKGWKSTGYNLPGLTYRTLFRWAFMAALFYRKFVCLQSKTPWKTFDMETSYCSVMSETHYDQFDLIQLSDHLKSAFRVGLWSSCSFWELFTKWQYRQSSTIWYLSFYQPLKKKTLKRSEIISFLPLSTDKKKTWTDEPSSFNSIYEICNGGDKYYSPGYFAWSRFCTTTASVPSPCQVLHSEAVPPSFASQESTVLGQNQACSCQYTATEQPGRWLVKVDVSPLKFIPTPLVRIRARRYTLRVCRVPGKFADPTIFFSVWKGFF